jgi:hypothetical protein
MRSMINSLLDPVVNFGKVTVYIGYDNIATEVILITGDGAKLPNPLPDGSFNLVWFNNSTYSDPSDDPYVEIVRCIARVGDTLTLMRAQEGTGTIPNLVGHAHNVLGKTYKMILSPTKKTIDDIQTESQSNISSHSALSTGVHGVGISTVESTAGSTSKVGTHASATSNVHGFDISGNAPAQTHDSSRHTGTIGDHTTNLSNVGSNTHVQIDTALTASAGHIAANGTSVHSLGTMSTQAANNVAITGGTITGITDLAVTDGGTGRDSAVAYAPICGGTTDIAPQQSVVSIGTTGQVLMSNGAGTLPTFQTISISGWTLTTKTANFTASIDNVILCDATSGAITITLPTATSNANKIYSVKKIDNSANTVTIDGNASETIDGALTQVISSQYDCLTIMCDGSAWYII